MTEREIVERHRASRAWCWNGLPSAALAPAPYLPLADPAGWTAAGRLSRPCDPSRAERPIERRSRRLAYCSVWPMNGQWPPWTAAAAWWGLLMSLDDDPWITDSIADPAKLHALGMVTVFWNMCEHALHGLFESVSRLPGDVSWAITHDMKDVTLCDKIMQMSIKYGFGDDGIDLIKNTIDVYDRCRLNRNQFTHFHFAYNGSVEPSRLERLKGPDRIRVEIDDRLDTIRRVADEILTLAANIVFVRSRVDRHYLHDEPITWPRRLDVPVLIWKLPPPEPPAQRRQPKSSRAKPKSADKEA